METHYLFTLAIFGVCLSLYALRVEGKAKKNKNYKALCDVNKTINCTKIFLSKEGHLFGISNAALGLFFYFTIFLLTYTQQRFYIIFLSLFAVLGSLVLLSISTFKLKKFCYVCTLIHLLNIFILIVAYNTL
tara:strand:+ start:3523 stop:3918 length:396 start_codon:yes stop_codon:yes gene_type:complete